MWMYIASGLNQISDQVLSCALNSLTSILNGVLQSNAVINVTNYHRVFSQLN